MRNKSIVFGTLIVIVSLAAPLLFYPLSPSRVLAEEPCDPAVTGGICPVPPPIGSITNMTVRTTKAGDPKWDINKLGAGVEVSFDILDDQGQPYFAAYTYIVNGQLVPVQMRFTVDLEKGDGQALPVYPVILSGASQSISEPTTLSVTSSYIRNKPCYAPSFPCTPEEQNLSYYANPLTPGPVYLKRLVIEIVTADQNATVVATNSYSTRTKLFTIANPPTITSVNKTSAKTDETVTITGTNFDAPAVLTYQEDLIVFDLVPANTAGGYQISRSISWVGNWWEDRVHYCGPTKLKFDWPPDIMIPPSSSSAVYTYPPMPTGPHTITFSNAFGFSNPVTVNFSGGQGTPENDPACRNEPGRISAITPTSGPEGTEVTIDGTGFSNYPASYRGDVSNNAVAFGGVPADNSYLVSLKYETYIDPQTGLPAYNGTQIIMRVPPGAKTGPVTVKPDGKYTIWGPTFTVTAGGGGGGPPPPPPPPPPPSTLSVTAITPRTLYIGGTNTVLIEGSGFTNSTTVSSDNPLITASNLAVNAGGASLRVDLNVGSAAAGSALILVREGANSASISATLAPRSANAAQISAVKVNSTSVSGQVQVIVSGKNFDNSTTGAILGLSNVIVTGFSVRSLTEAVFDAAVFSFPVQGAFGFLKRALAAPPNDAGLVTMSNSQGGSSAALNGAQLSAATASSASTVSTLSLSPTGFENICSKGTPLAVCVQQLYLLSLGLGAIIALLMLVLAGYRYMTAQGNAQQVEKAKEAFASAFIGLIIIFVAFILLYLINPELVQFKPLPLPPIPAPTTPPASP